MIKRLSIDVNAKNQQLLINLSLAGEEKDLRVSMDYSKKTEGGETQIHLSNIKSSKEWLTVLFNDVLIGEEVISEDDLKISSNGVGGKLLAIIL